MNYKNDVKKYRITKFKLKRLVCSGLSTIFNGFYDLLCNTTCTVKI